MSTAQGHHAVAAEAILLSIHLGAAVPAVLREIASIACDRYLSNASGMLETIGSRLSSASPGPRSDDDDDDKAEEVFHHLSAFSSTTCILRFAASAQKLLPSLTSVRQSLRDVCASSLPLMSSPPCDDRRQRSRSQSAAASLLNAIATHNLAVLYGNAIVAGEDMDVNPTSGERDSDIQPFVERISAELEQLIARHVLEADPRRGLEEQEQGQGQEQAGLVANCALAAKLYSSALYHESLLMLCQASKQFCGESLKTRLHGLLLWHITKLCKGDDEAQASIVQDLYAVARARANRVARNTLAGNAKP